MNVEKYFVDFLKKNQLKVTPERLLILRELYNVDQHFDADEFFLHLKKNKVAVSRATVYRTLELLEKSNIIKKYSMGEAHSRYELVWNQQHHDHIICLKCGNIIEFLDEEIEKRQEAIAERFGVKLIKHSLQLWGICESCLKEN
ncbi:MAG: Fur family transcriptional regulator [Calditrichia bacterium]